MRSGYIERLILRVRRAANVTNSTATLGITNDYIIDLLNDAQEDLFVKITNEVKNAFQSTIELDVSDSITPVSSRLALGIRILDVKVRNTGVDFWSDLPKLNLEQREDFYEGSFYGFNHGYTVQNGNIILIPENQNGTSKLRVTFEQQIDALARRGASITGSTVTSGSLNQIDVSYLNNISDVDFQNDPEKVLCVIGSDGSTKIRNATYSLASPGLISINSHVLQEGESISNLDYVCLGENVTTHPQFSKECHRYLIHYAAEQLSGSKAASFERQTYLRRQKEDALESIIEAYRIGTKDTLEINIDNYDLVGRC